MLDATGLIDQAVINKSNLIHTDQANQQNQLDSSMSSFKRSRSLPSGSVEARVEHDDFEVKFLAHTLKNQIASTSASKSSSKPATKKASISISKISHRSPSARDEYKDPFFDPPPSFGVRSAPMVQNSQSEDTPNLDSLLESDSLLNVEIISSVEGSNFYIPLSLMVEREIMMRKTAEEFGIGPERWSSSLLYREWRKAQDDISSTAEDRAFQQSNGDVSIYLSPEADCAASNHSQSLKWTPWLTTCIRAFYNTGTVRFPNDCVGSDVLLALEYFGIVYTPDQLVFDSFGAYLRVKLWSEYFTHRSGLAQWVVETLMQTNSKHSHTYVTSPSLQEGDLLVGSKRADVLDGHLQLDPTKYSGTPSNAVVHDFFHDEDRPEDVQYPLDALMREDFAHYVENSLPGTRVTFTLKDVQVVRTGKTVKRATLHVAFVEPPLQSFGPPKQAKKVSRDSPGIKASRTLPSSPSRAKKTPPPAPQVPRRTKSRSPSPAGLLRRVGSAIRNSASSTESAPKIPRSKSSCGNTHETPVSDVSLNKVKVVPIASQVNEEENAVIREKSRLGASADAAIDGKCQSPLDSAMLTTETQDAQVPCPPSPAPFDEHENVKRTSTAPSDEQKESPDPRAPVNAIWDGDMNTVISALTSPFREEESIKLSKSSVSVEALASKRSIPLTPTVSNVVQAASNKAPDCPKEKGVEVSLASHNMQRILEEETTLGTATDFMSSLATERSSIVDPFCGLRSGVQECGSSDILSSTFRYFFGKSIPDTVKTKNRGPKLGPNDVDMESLAGNGKGAMTTIEDFLPDVDLQTVADEPELKQLASTSSEPSETIESSAAAWLRRAINVNQMIFDDPVPANDDDEYLRLVRQAEAANIKSCMPHDEYFHLVRKAEAAAARCVSHGETAATRCVSHSETAATRCVSHSETAATRCMPQDRYPDNVPKTRTADEDKEGCMPRDSASAGTLVKDILDSLMNDNNSFLGGSVASTDASTAYSTVGSVSTPSTKLTKAGPFIPFDCDSSLESGENPQANPSKSRTPTPTQYQHQQAVAPATPAGGGVTLLSRFPSRERRRFPTPQRNVNHRHEIHGEATTPRADVGEPSYRNGGMAPTTRHASPLSRIPGLISGRKRGKNRGDETTETEITTKVHNGLKPVWSKEGGEEDTSAALNIAPNRLAGLFRSKGLVRRRSLGEGGKELDQPGLHASTGTNIQ